jgi:hypothetical protein
LVCFCSSGQLSFHHVGCVGGLRTPATSVSLVDSHTSEGPSPAPVSTAVGFAFPFHSRSGGVCLTPQLCPEGPSQPLSIPLSGVAELGEARFCLCAFGF